MNHSCAAKHGNGRTHYKPKESLFNYKNRRFTTRCRASSSNQLAASNLLYVVEASIQCFVFLDMLRKKNRFEKKAVIKIDLDQYRNFTQRAIFYKTF